MKKFKSLFCLFVIAALAFAGCSLSGDDDDAVPPPPGVIDNPQSDSMTTATVSRIFDYSQGTQSVTIEKFKDATALENYLGGEAFHNAP
jgi:hypothetical protein